METGPVKTFQFPIEKALQAAHKLVLNIPPSRCPLFLGERDFGRPLFVGLARRACWVGTRVLKLLQLHGELGSSEL